MVRNRTESIPKTKPFHFYVSIKSLIKTSFIIITLYPQLQHELQVNLFPPLTHSLSILRIQNITLQDENDNLLTQSRVRVESRNWSWQKMALKMRVQSAFSVTLLISVSLTLLAPFPATLFLCNFSFSYRVDGPWHQIPGGA